MWNVDLSCDIVPLIIEKPKAVEQEVWRDAQKMDEKVSSELGVAVCITKFDLFELECSFNSSLQV